MFKILYLYNKNKLVFCHNPVKMFHLDLEHVFNCVETVWDKINNIDVLLLNFVEKMFKYRCIFRGFSYFVCKDCDSVWSTIFTYFLAV